MLLTIAFICFAALFVSWILTPTSAPEKVTEPLTSSAMSDAETAPALTT